MPVNFTCPHCGQLLSVAKRKAGQAVQCLRCHGRVIVPPPPAPNAASTSTAGPEPAESDQAHEHRNNLANVKIEVTRWALYSVGALIVVSTLVGFGLGWGLGRQGARQVDLTDPASWQRVSGRVSYLTRRGRSVPDSEAVILALPANRKPDEKLSNESFRPDTAPANVSQTMLGAVRTLGGGYARANRDGIYEIELPLADEYFLLIISSHVSRPARTQPTTKQIVEIGQYFDKASELVAKNDFVWQKQIVKGRISKDHQFGE